MNSNITLSIDTDNTGMRLRITTREGRELLNVEYDAGSSRLFAWDLTDPRDVGPDITIDIEGK